MLNGPLTFKDLYDLNISALVFDTWVIKNVRAKCYKKSFPDLNSVIHWDLFFAAKRECLDPSRSFVLKPGDVHRARSHALMLEAKVATLLGAPVEKKWRHGDMLGPWEIPVAWEKLGKIIELNDIQWLNDGFSSHVVLDRTRQHRPPVQEMKVIGGSENIDRFATSLERRDLNVSWIVHFSFCQPRVVD